MNTPSLPISPETASSSLICEEMGRLAVPTGTLAFGDPFQGMTRYHNPHLDLAPGSYRIVRTMMRHDDGQHTPLFLSLVIDEHLLAHRQAWQRERWARGEDDQLPPHAIAEIDEEDGEAVALWVPCPSGSIAMSDANLFAEGMPADMNEPGKSWYDRLFEHGVEGSWFDALDSNQPLGAGAAMIKLPHADGMVAIAQGAPGDKHIFLECAFVEYFSPEEAMEGDEDLEALVRDIGPAIALHFDLS